MSHRYKSHIFVGFGLLVAIVSFYLYIQFTHTPTFQIFMDWSKSNLVIFCVTIFILKVIGTVYPPLPGGLLTLGAIPIIGWVPAYAIDFLGSATAGSIDYYLGYKYGMPFLKKVLDPGTLENIQRLKIKKDKELESIFVMRVLLGSTIIEAINYGAGLLKVSYKNFFIGSIASHLLYGIPAFYIGESLIRGENVVYSLVSIVITVFIFWKIKGRYFE